MSITKGKGVMDMDVDSSVVTVGDRRDKGPKWQWE